MHVLGWAHRSRLQLLSGGEREFVSVFGDDRGGVDHLLLLYVGLRGGVHGRLRVKKLSKKVEKQQVQRQVVIDEKHRFISWRVVK